MYSSTRSEIGKRIKGLIKNVGFKQKEFAKSINMPIGTLNNIVRGIREPGISKLVDIADGLGANIHYIATGQGEPFVQPGGRSPGGIHQEITLSGGHNKSHNVIKDINFGNQHGQKQTQAGGKVSQLIQEAQELTPAQLELVLAYIQGIKSK